MSECAGENCTHPECTERDPFGQVVREGLEALRVEMRREVQDIPPEKLAVMNRRERRAAVRQLRR